MTQGGGFLVPQDSWYGGYEDVSAPGLRAWAWRIVGTVASMVGISAGHDWFSRGMTSVHYPGVAGELIKQRIKEEAEAIRDKIHGGTLYGEPLDESDIDVLIVAAYNAGMLLALNKFVLDIPVNEVK